MSIPMPPWLTALPQENQETARQKFLLSAAALYALPKFSRARTVQEARAVWKMYLKLSVDEPVPLTLPSYLRVRQGGGQKSVYPLCGNDRTRFVLKLAALYCTEAGSLNAMSRALGFSSQTLTVFASSRGRVSMGFCRRFRAYMKCDVVPLALINPEMFADLTAN